MSGRFLSSGRRRSFFFHTLARWLPKPKHHHDAMQPSRAERILVLAPVHRGDYLILSPLLHALSKEMPRTRIAVMVKPAGYELALVDPNVDKVFLWNKITTWPRTLYQIKKYKADVVMMPKGHPSVTELLVMLLSGAPLRIALSHPQHDRFLTHPIPHDWDNEHRSVAFVRMMQPFGVDPTSISRRLRIGTTPEAEEWADGHLTKQEHEHSCLALNVSALSESRVWTLQGWRAFIREMVSIEPNVRFVALGMPSDQSLLRSLEEEFEQVRYQPTPGMLEATALIARCDALITVDTGIVQAAAARGVPMVVLYNGDHEVYTRFGPQSVPHRAVLAERGHPVAAIQASEVLHETVHLLVERKLGNWIIRPRSASNSAVIR
ncbi:hypothetical protein GF324_02060 [bacterium]|nr:hypothetical protein [bacterium]